MQLIYSPMWIEMEFKTTELLYISAERIAGGRISKTQKYQTFTVLYHMMSWCNNTGRVVFRTSTINFSVDLGCVLDWNDQML